MNADELFVSKRPRDLFAAVITAVGERADPAVLTAIRQGPQSGDRADPEVAFVLLRQLRSDLEGFGTNSAPRFLDEDLPDAIRAARGVTRRLGVPFDLPFRSYTDWRSYWIEQGCKGSWACRRQLVADLFDEAILTVRGQAEQAEHFTVADPISPAKRTGWAEVDAAVINLRRIFGMAATPEDYANVGNSCVRLLEALSAAAYDPARHGLPGEPDPAVANTKARFDRIVNVEAPGPDNAELRKLGRATIEFAQRVKHATPTRREAGLAADSIVLVVNVLRRLRDDE